MSIFRYILARKTPRKEIEKALELKKEYYATKK